MFYSFLNDNTFYKFNKDDNYKYKSCTVLLTVNSNSYTIYINASTGVMEANVMQVCNIVLLKQSLRKIIYV